MLTVRKNTTLLQKRGVCCSSQFHARGIALKQGPEAPMDNTVQVEELGRGARGARVKKPPQAGQVQARGNSFLVLFESTRPNEVTKAEGGLDGVREGSLHAHSTLRVKILPVG